MIQDYLSACIICGEVLDGPAITFSEEVIVCRECAEKIRTVLNIVDAHESGVHVTYHG